MDSQNERSYPDAAFIGRTLMEEAFPLRLEAFSGNALYCRRGMPTMNRYKTVKEVCALTGLTRKHLYYFHHEKVVQAVAYSNYSVEGNDGYKLYDDAAVEKLRQSARKMKGKGFSAADVADLTGLTADEINAL